MAPTPTAPSPLQPLSPSAQNLPSARSPFGKALPLRKPSLREPRPSPQKTKRDTSQTQDRPQPKRRKVEEDYDMAERLNHEIETKYVKGKKLGEGTYAVVYKGHLKSDASHIVAIKKFKVKDQGHGINVDTIREIKYLQELSHNNIVALYDIYSSKDQTFNAVIEFFACGNLEDLIKDNDLSYGLAEIKAWMGMLWRAIYFCHSNFVLHRDIKPGNLLLAADGELKLADFGLARSFAGPELNMTANVITLWYRPPELLFGARHYSGAVDIWSVGLILAELLIRRPFVAYVPENQRQLEEGGGEIGQLDLINQALGTPSEEVWPGVSKLDSFVKLEPQLPIKGKRDFEGYFQTCDETGLELLMWTLTMDPRRRPSAKECLEHEWWNTEPRPTNKDKLPRKGHVDEASVAKEMSLKPGVVDEKFKGVARKLEFGGPR